jgi:hypothetical protein
MFFQQSVTDKELYINILDIFREIMSNNLAFKTSPRPSPKEREYFGVLQPRQSPVRAGQAGRCAGAGAGEIPPLKGVRGMI